MISLWSDWTHLQVEGTCQSNPLDCIGERGDAEHRTSSSTLADLLICGGEIK